MRKTQFDIKLMKEKTVKIRQCKNYTAALVTSR